MIKAKSLLKVWVLALAMIFTIALALGVTGAAYNATRRADGTIVMAGGIEIAYTGFGKAEDGEWAGEQTTTFKLFADRAILPGDTINLNAASIKKGAGSIDFFARIRIDYKFYNSSNEDVTASILDYSVFMTTPEFNSAWVDGNAGDGWFYYATGSTLNALPASYVNIFAGTPAINIALNAEGFNHEGGGYKYSNEILITKVEAVLTLEAVQIAGSNWEIIPQYTDAAGVVYTQNQDETWTLTDGTALSANSSNTTATYSARIYTSSYSYTVLSQINNQDVVAIGDAAFLNASQLTSVEIPTTISTIGSRAFEGTGLTTLTLPESVEAVGADALATNSLTEVTIENNQAVVTGIETAGIPTASAINVPSAVLESYQTTLGSGYTGLNKILEPIVLNAVESEELFYGEYMATDNEGNKWYFNLGTLDVNQQSWEYDPNGLDAEVRYCRLETSNLNQIIRIPNAIILPNSEHIAYIKQISPYAYDGYFVSDTNSDFSLVIPNSVLIINSNAFQYCSHLTSIEIPNSVTYISGGAFWYCTGLTSIEIPSSVTSIGSVAFYGCIGLTSITIPNSVTSIGDSAFSYCESLTSITIPNLVTSIGYDAFYGCTGLTEVIIDSATIAALNSSDSYLRDYATTVYVLDGLTVGDYIGNWGHTTESDKAGYVKYVKNS